MIAAMEQDPPPRRLILGGSGVDTVAAALDGAMAELRRNETLSRGADFPAGA